MGAHPNVKADSLPKQGHLKDRPVRVVFNYTSPAVMGRCIRHDVVSPFVTLFQLEDGRVVTEHEVEFREDLNAA